MTFLLPTVGYIQSSVI